MSRQDYVGSRQRTFQQAVIGMLEQNYGLLGSRRVLELLAAEVQELVDQFYPCPDHLRPGWMVFTGTRGTGGKTHPGQRAGEHELVTLAWPVLLEEDLAYLIAHSDNQVARRTWFQQRLVRLVEYGCQQPNGPVLLTEADLALLTGLSRAQVGPLLEEARQATGKPLLTKGYYFDQGMRPSHKGEIIALYEAGLDEAEIAQRSDHAPESVGQYIRDYERVKRLVAHGTPVEQISRLIDMKRSVVAAYAKMIAEYHPELLRAQEPAPGTA
jgi:hypothetical protein